MCVQRGLFNKSIDPLEDPSQFCAATLSRLSTIGYDVCDLCGAKFSVVTTRGCLICGMGIKRSDAISVPVPSPFGQASLSAQQACELLSIGGREIVVAYETIVANNDGTTYKIIIDEVEDWTVKLFGVRGKTFEDMVWDIQFEWIILTRLFDLLSNVISLLKLQGLT
ncbi:Transducin/WD40 repeat-like superfamily protein [Thalictrum thalictroides]|uniref:Transducin/WD40 repeat-like superfamily protein n=1 Tax=Thalictrum thalictroides TaxID=46969 RepID=A0A7J6WUI0_THATH|nr:Transducin/WD40 repeat-like superfamily protein [Thalictrum thalictroides]